MKGFATRIAVPSVEEDGRTGMDAVCDENARTSKTVREELTSVSDSYW